MDEQLIIEAAWNGIREQRNALLRATDHTQLSDSPLSESLAEQMRIYRQALRDVPNQNVQPWEIVWPISPINN